VVGPERRIAARRLSDEDEEPLALHSDALVPVSVEVLEGTFRHLYERSRMAERNQVPGVHDPDVMIAAESRLMAPLLQVHGVGARVPRAFDVDERAERRQMKSVSGARSRLERPAPRALVPIAH
jgi:hypothetical protein